MSEALARQSDAARVVQSLHADRALELEDVASALDLSTATLAAILTDKEVSKVIHDIAKSRALLAQNAVANRLVRLANSTDEKIALAAAGMLLKLSGGMKPQGVNVRISFDDLMKQAANAGPLNGLTQIVEGVIDADEEEMEEHGETDD